MCSKQVMSYVIKAGLNIKQNKHVLRASREVGAGGGGGGGDLFYGLLWFIF